MDKPLKSRVAREVIKIQVVKSRMEPNGIGYVRLSQFTEQADAGDPGRRQGSEEQEWRDRCAGLILDLRNDPGGSAGSGDRSLLRLRRARRDRFDPRAVTGRQPALGRAGQRYPGGCPAGGADQRRLGLGVRDRRRRVAGPPPGRASGTRNFGKGSVQTVIPLPGGGAMR